MAKKKTTKRNNKQALSLKNKLQLKLGKFFYPVLGGALTLIITGTGLYIYQQNNSGAGRTERHGGIVDISYPQCGRSIRADHGIVGVNNGKPRTKNRCMAKQAKGIKNYALYVNSSYTTDRRNNKKPDCKKDMQCHAIYTGFNDGVYSFNYAKSKRLSAKQWWIDVEHLNAWSNDKELNIQYLTGMARALKNNGVQTVGYYSTGHQWGEITGGWQNNNPAWVATGLAPPSGYQNASNAGPCGRAFTGGSAWLVQYVNFSLNLDVNIPCGSTFRQDLQNS